MIVKQVKTALPYLIGAGALFGGFIAWLNSRLGVPEGAAAISPFEVDRYLGNWYEIARINHFFESHLQNVTAEYALNDNGTLKVINRGQDDRTGEWKQSSGLASFVKDTDEARLKVSFFGPFYGAYNVIAIDEDYQHALVAGHNLNYLWLLSRQKHMPAEIKAQFLDEASIIGYDTDKLIWTKQQPGNYAK